MHIGAYLAYTNHTSCFRPIKFLAPLSGRSFRVDIDNSAIRYYSGIYLFLFILFFVYISACNMVFVLLRVTTVKVIVSACTNGVKLNYLRLILNQKEPYTVYAEN